MCIWLFTYQEKTRKMRRILYIEINMFKAVSRVLVWAVILVAFIGQAMTFNASMPCETSVESHYTSLNELVNNYDSNSIDTDNQEDCCGIECCSINCACIGNACASFVYFNAEVDSTKSALLSEAVYIQQSEQPKSILTLRYRPPIFTS